MTRPKLNRIKFFRGLGVFMILFALFSAYQNCGNGVPMYKKKNKGVQAFEKLGCDEVPYVPMEINIDTVNIQVGDPIIMEIPNTELYQTMLISLGEDAQGGPDIAVKLDQPVVRQSHQFSRPGKFVVKFQAVDKCFYGRVESREVCVRAPGAAPFDPPCGQPEVQCVNQGGAPLYFDCNHNSECCSDHCVAHQCLAPMNSVQRVQ